MIHLWKNAKVTLWLSCEKSEKHGNLILIGFSRWVKELMKEYLSGIVGICVREWKREVILKQMHRYFILFNKIQQCIDIVFFVQLGTGAVYRNHLFIDLMKLPGNCFGMRSIKQCPVIRW